MERQDGTLVVLISAVSPVLLKRYLAPGKRIKLYNSSAAAAVPHTTRGEGISRTLGETTRAGVFMKMDHVIFREGIQPWNARGLQISSRVSL